MKSNSFGIEVELHHFVERKGFGIVKVPICYMRRFGAKELIVRISTAILESMMQEAPFW